MENNKINFNFYQPAQIQSAADFPATLSQTDTARRFTESPYKPALQVELEACQMKLLWIRWAGGIETRDDGFSIFHDPRFIMLKYPDGRLEKFRTVTEAKRAADHKEAL